MEKTTISTRSYLECLKAMTDRGRKGEPGVDALTYGKRKKEGRIVKKGEKSFYKSISRPVVEDKETGKKRKIMICYSLFHRSQTKPLK